jgi:NADH-quinone oxidoreductase subunit N
VPSIAQMFQSTDYQAALPMLLLTIFALGILLIDLILPEELKWTNAALAFGGVLFAVYALYEKIQVPLERAHQPGMMAFVGSMLVDHFTLYFWYLFLAAAGLSILMSVHYMDVEREHHGEFYALLLFSVVGMMCMAAGVDVVLIFIGLELMAISTYVLVGFLRRDRRSNEAALKYLLLGAFSSGIFAYGLSLFYGLTGSTNLLFISHELGNQIATAGGHVDPVAVLALVTVCTGLFFKIAAVPFHQWAPDAYEGAPTSITGFMSVAVKAAAWTMLLRILVMGLYPLQKIWVPLLIFVSIITMTGANLAALTQNNLKRLLAYSSIAHVGYMLLGLVAYGSDRGVGAADGIKGILIYLLVYTFMNLGAFAVITSLRRREVIGDEIDDIAGLFFRAPTEAILMLVFLLSLAGIPPLAGFWGKYFIFLSLMETGHYVLASLAVLYAVFGLYYYMRIANAAFIRQAIDKEPVKIGLPMATTLGITAMATLVIGIFPEPFIDAVNWALGLARTPTVANLVR